ncbi:MAG TPA: murein L,D-transpeptidase catalytic domain family protein [Allosphingosinicella sp.]|nr:murein L,D-transpeptidase catalytic domain family protein [Allosphingosinicella sp.]
MIYSRRQLLGAGLSAGFLATAAQGQSLAQIVAGLKDPAPKPLPVRPIAHAVVPVQPRVVVSGAIDPRLLARARAAFERHRSQLHHTDVVGIADFSRPSYEHRFFLLDTATGRVSNHLVAHGRGSDPVHSGLLQRFSNQIGSEASSQGGYRTGEYYHGKYGRSLRLSGLDWSNSNAHTRAIVVHSAWYAEPEQLAAHGKLGRSEGCFALPYNSLQQVLARLGPGRFLYADKLA